MLIFNQTKQVQIGTEIKLADNFFTRLVGLLTTKQLPPGAGLLIRPCASVHTFGMRYAIDIVFADKHNRVMKIVSALPPGRLAMARNSAYVVELPAGTLAATGTEVDDVIRLEPGR